VNTPKGRNQRLAALYGACGLACIALTGRTPAFAQAASERGADPAGLSALQHRGEATVDAKIASQIQMLVDTHDIDQLITRFAQDLDTRNTDDLPSVVTPEAIPMLTSALHNMQALWQFTQHVITDRSIELHGDDTATVRANLVGSNMGSRPSGAGGDPYDASGRAHYEVHGRYVWKVIRTKDGWRIAKTDLTYLWSSGAIPGKK